MAFLRMLSRLIVGRPGRVLAAIGLVTLVLGGFATRIHIDPSADGIVDRRDPTDVRTREMRKIFGHEEIDVVVVEADDVFSPSALEAIRRVTERLQALPGVDEVESLTHLRVIDETVEGVAEYAPVVPSLPLDEAGLARLRRLARENPFLTDTLIGRDGKASAIVLRYSEMPEHEFVGRRIHEGVERVLAEEQGAVRLSIFGAPTMKAEAARIMRKDLIGFTNGTTIVVGAILLLSFRRLLGVALPLLSVGIGLVWTVGLMAATGTPLDVLGLLLPSILLAVGSAYATHVVARYYDECRRGGTRPEIVLRAIGGLSLPVFVTALTTILGFASLAVYRIEAIRRLGLFLAFGTSALFVLSLVFVPAALALLPLRRGAGAPGEPEWPRLRRALERVVRFDLRRRRLVLAVGALVVALSALGMTRLHVETSYATYFPEGSQIRRAEETVREHFGGTTSFYLVVESPRPDGILSLESLRRIEAIESFVRRIPGVVKTLSIVDVVEVANRAIAGGSGELVLPDVDEAVPQLLLLVPPSATQPFLSPDGRMAAIHVRSHLWTSRLLREALDRIERFGTDLMPEDHRFSAVGAAVVLNRAADSLAGGQVSSVATATAVVFLSMALFFLSARLGLVAMIPNLVPVVLFFGILGWLDIPLSISTGIVASIALGIGVDEAIHLLAEFNHHVRRTEDQDEAVVAAMATVGPPVVITTLALSLGFLVPALSSFVPIRQFALLSALNVLTSLAADLFLLPAFLGSVRFVTLWDLLRTRFGAPPEKAIPLFHGLRPAQAKSVVLMGQLRRYASGERILERGGNGDSLAILIDGAAEVSIGRNGDRTLLGRLGRGDVAGEIGLLLGEPRTADVTATEPCDLLLANDRFFELLRDRHPRIAAVVFYNLSRILCRRVASLTKRVSGEELSC